MGSPLYGKISSACKAAAKKLLQKRNLKYGHQHTLQVGV